MTWKAPTDEEMARAKAAALHRWNEADVFEKLRLVRELTANNTVPLSDFLVFCGLRGANLDPIAEGNAFVHDRYFDRWLEAEIQTELRRQRRAERTG